jgi:hypothetical protein
MLLRANELDNYEAYVSSDPLFACHPPYIGGGKQGGRDQFGGSLSLHCRHLQLSPEE